VEKANSFIFQAMKKILKGERKGKWAEVMPMAVWSHNTTVCMAPNFTPFQLIYGTEALLPEEIKHWSLRVAAECTPCPSEAEEKDLLESDRLKAVTNMKKYQEETRACRDLRVKLKQFKVGNMVLLRSPHMENSGKFEAKWIEPYVVSERTRSGAYMLSDTQLRVLEHSWNTENLHHFYIRMKIVSGGLVNYKWLSAIVVVAHILLSRKPVLFYS
jgi:hypothetical protein